MKCKNIETNSIFDLRKSLNYLWKLYFIERGRRGKILKAKILVLMLAFLMMATISASLLPVRAQLTGYGPRTSNMHISIFLDPDTENMALEGCEVDINDWPLAKYWIDKWAVNPAIVMRDYSEIGMFEIDINNEMWPTGVPGAMPETEPAEGTDEWRAWQFRKAIAYCLDKNYLKVEVLKGYGYIMETPVPVPALAGYTDYYDLETKGLIYHYDPATAEAILDNAGFADTDGDGIRNDPKTGDNLEPLIFYIRLDDPNRKMAGEALAAELESIGVPVDARVVERTVCYKSVMVEYNFHLYTGGWSLGADVDFLYDLFHSSMYWGPDIGWSVNYDGFQCPEYDYWAEKVKYGTSPTEIKEAALKCQEIFNKYVAMVPMWCSAGVKAYKAGWEGVVNYYGYGIDNGYTFLMMYNPDDDTIDWGFKSHPEAIHVISSEWVWDWNVIGLMYDSLLGRNPYNLAEDRGFIAESWYVGTWTYNGENATYVDFVIADGATFHDGSPVTPDDIKFSLEFVRDCGSGVAWNYPSVMDLVEVEILNDTAARAKFGVQSAWALHWAGFMPILNKDVWMAAIGPGTDAGYDPDTHTFTGPKGAMAVREYHPWEEDRNGNGVVDIAEDGSGPWVWYGADELLHEYIELLAFNTENYEAGLVNGYYHISRQEMHDYLADAFRRIGDVNKDGKIDILDIGLIARALGTTPASGGTPGAWDAWNPDADLDGDGTVGLADLTMAGRNFGLVSG